MDDGMNAESIKEWRARIDAVDDQIVELLLARIELSNLVMKSKPPAQTVDRSREREIAARYSRKLSEVSTTAKSERVALAIIAASSRYPEDQR